MKREQTIGERIRVALKYIKTSKGFGLVEYCERCGSHEIQSIEPNKDNKYKCVIYTTKYVCKKCGATADVKEVWSWE